MIEETAARVPAAYRKLYGRALAGSVSPRQAIKLKCLDCCGWHRIEDSVDRIGDCTVRACPLWPLRPFQSAQESAGVAR